MLDFVNQARGLPMFRQEPNVKLHVLIFDGVALPRSFFDVSPEELRKVAYVFFLTKTFQAIEIDAPFLPQWELVRHMLVAA